VVQVAPAPQKRDEHNTQQGNADRKRR
jgi:hypothetical protein